jgi:quercetin 2,3-dioxygenase
MCKLDVMSKSEIVGIESLGFPWATSDPFLFCVYHNDAYPKGNEKMGPAASLAGRRIGQDFEGKDGWRMYHGQVIPGFPRHPHRGFETVTIVRRGYIDHSDSLGATARFGHGDVQWMTAGRGIEHCEMFPLVKTEQDNPLELFQIWLNLPARNKLVEPHFKMLWNHTIPRKRIQDSEGRVTEVVLTAGRLEESVAPKPPPNSWASGDGSDVAMWTIRMQPGAKWSLPATDAGVGRSLYWFQGNQITIAGKVFNEHARIQIRPDAVVELVNGDSESELLMLQGRPIGETVAQYGPFVMNTQQEIRQAIVDFQNGKFGRWPWEGDAPVHSREETRFAIHTNGQEERPES